MSSTLPWSRGRDFVSERLEIRKKALEADLALRRERIERKIEIGSTWGSFRRARWMNSRPSMRVRAGEVEDIETGLTLAPEVRLG